VNVTIEYTGTNGMKYMSSDADNVSVGVVQIIFKVETAKMEHSGISSIIF
jgi:hypothetical protein